MSKLKSWMKKFSDQSGATAIEYGLIASAIALVILSSMRLIGSRVNTTFTTISNAI